MTNLIEIAVAPLKADAMDRAEQNATETVKKVKEALAKAGNDLEKCAPYPRSYGSEYNGKADYLAKLGRRHLFDSLTKWRQGSHKHGDPCLVDVTDERVAKFIKEAREDAAAQYESFVQKLIHKIGDVTEAILDGNHVWSYSFLNITKPDGEKQIWKTHMIINVSKLGKYFNQWPTRKVKAKTARD